MTEQPAEYEIISTLRARAMDYHRLAAVHYRTLADAGRLAIEALKLCPEFVREDQRAAAIHDAHEAIAQHLALAYEHDARREHLLKTDDPAKDQAPANA